MSDNTCLFFSIKVKPGQTKKVAIPENSVLQLSQATLRPINQDQDEKKDKSKKKNNSPISRVFIILEDEEEQEMEQMNSTCSRREIAICALSSNCHGHNAESQKLDLCFTSEYQLSIKVVGGNCPVLLTGHYLSVEEDEEEYVDDEMDYDDDYDGTHEYFTHYLGGGNRDYSDSEDDEDDEQMMYYEDESSDDDDHFPLHDMISGMYSGAVYSDEEEEDDVEFEDQKPTVTFEDVTEEEEAKEREKQQQQEAQQEQEEQRKPSESTDV